MAPEEERALRHGLGLFETAKKYGWKDDGEGPYEFMSRKAYEVGYQDAYGRSDNDKTKIEKIVQKLRTLRIPGLPDDNLGAVIYAGVISTYGNQSVFGETFLESEGKTISDKSDEFLYQIAEIIYRGEMSREVRQNPDY